METGVHPEIAAANREKELGRQEVPLPETDPHRPFVFWDISIGSKAVGRWVLIWVLMGGMNLVFLADKAMPQTNFFLLCVM